MKRILPVAIALAASATAAAAGGLDRSGQGIGILFEPGTVVELSFATVTPQVSGVGAGTTPSLVTPTPGAASGSMAPTFIMPGFGYKQDLGKSLSLALIYDQPFGADASYPLSSYFAATTTAKLSSNALTALLRYKLPSNFSVYGGVRYLSMKATASIPFVAGYKVTGNGDSGFGYVVGAAYEKPEMALRVALTYSSKVTLNLPTTETGGSAPGTSTTKTKTPQSVNLDFQSGVAPKTLVFGSIRWVNWKDFKLTPADFLATAHSSLVSYNGDTTTYTLGVGHKFDEHWSGAVTFGYEAQTGGFSLNLSPVDGQTSIGVGGSYTNGKMKITGGLQYIKIGNANTTLGGGVAAANFTSNRAVAAGLKVAFNF